MISDQSPDAPDDLSSLDDVETPLLKIIGLLADLSPDDRQLVRTALDQYRYGVIDTSDDNPGGE